MKLTAKQGRKGGQKFKCRRVGQEQYLHACWFLGRGRGQEPSLPHVELLQGPSCQQSRGCPSSTQLRRNQPHREDFRPFLSLCCPNTRLCIVFVTWPSRAGDHLGCTPCFWGLAAASWGEPPPVVNWLLSICLIISSDWMLARCKPAQATRGSHHLSVGLLAPGGHCLGTGGRGEVSVQGSSVKRLICLIAPASPCYFSMNDKESTFFTASSTQVWCRS